MKRLIVGGVAALTVARATAAPASAMHTRGYLDTLDAGGRSTKRDVRDEALTDLVWQELAGMVDVAAVGAN